MDIPIRNLFYMLCYAWERPVPARWATTGAEAYPSALDLCAHLLCEDVCGLLRRGLTPDWTTREEASVTLRGRPLFERGIGCRNPLPGIVCRYDELDSATPANRVIRTTMHRLLHTAGLARGLAERVTRLSRLFPPMPDVELCDRLFDTVRVPRYPPLYRRLWSVCRLIHASLGPTEGGYGWRFADFRQDEERMSALFEAFVRGFYRQERREYRLLRPRIRWRLDGDPSLLPRMEPDLVLLGASRKVLIDTKYYTQALVSHHDGAAKLRSGHLFQMYAYLLNQRDAADERSLHAAGVLLYPRTDGELRCDYRFEGLRLAVRTIDLARPWPEIDRRLRSLPEEV